MLRVTVTGVGWPGAPSINQYYFQATDLGTFTHAGSSWNRVRAAWEQLKTLCPNTVTHTLSQTVEVLNHVNGELISEITAVGEDPIVEGVGTGLHMPPATALCMQLNTPGFIAGRRVRGRSFISPIAQGSSDADGTPTAAAIAIVTAVSGIMTTDTGSDENYCVWSRPVKAAEGVTARDGSMHAVTSISTPDRFAVLRSRRD